MGRIRNHVAELQVSGKWDELDEEAQNRYQDKIDQEDLGKAMAEKIGNSVNRDHVLFEGFIDALKNEHPTLIGQIWNGMCEVIEAREHDGRLSYIVAEGAHKVKQPLV